MLLVKMINRIINAANEFVYPGIPAAPTPTDIGRSSRKSNFVRFFPVATACVLQPKGPTTFVPMGNVSSLLSITLHKKKIAAQSSDQQLLS
jgi:hypothetical protein